MEVKVVDISKLRARKHQGKVEFNEELWDSIKRLSVEQMSFMI